MSQFKFLKITNFEYFLKFYTLIAETIQKEIADEQHELSKHSLDFLVESTFLQIYSELEASLYNESEHHPIKKKASLSRFEHALRELGFIIDNEYWLQLLAISKIRNCLLHGNGRIDDDQYGQDTKDTINQLNSYGGVSLIELVNVLEHQRGSKIKIYPSFLFYCCRVISNFINAQNK